jgi:hypothetical protein
LQEIGNPDRDPPEGYFRGGKEGSGDLMGKEEAGIDSLIFWNSTFTINVGGGIRWM